MPKMLRLRSYFCSTLVRLIMQSFLAIGIGIVYYRFFTELTPEGSLEEYLVLVFDSNPVSLILLPLLLLVLSSDRQDEQCRYPVLIRYKSRSAFFYTRVRSKVMFAVLFLAVTVVMLAVVGIVVRLSGGSYQQGMQQIVMELAGDVKYGSVLGKMFLNVLCYLWSILVLHEIFQCMIGNRVKDVVCTISLPIVNLVLVKLHLTALVRWLPWGNIAYTLEGWERSNYHFYWQYWGLVLLLLFYIADYFHQGKDYVFEKDRKTG